MKKGHSGLNLFLLVCVLLSTVTFWAPVSWAAPGAHEKGRVVIVVIDFLGLQDLRHPAANNLRQLMAQGSVGLLNTTTGGGRVPANTYLTVGAGAHAVGTKGALSAYEWSEQGLKVAEEFFQRTGHLLRPGNVAVLEIARIARENEKLDYPVVPGALGSTLRGAGLKVACLGNADWRDQPGRQVAVVAMDKSGVVPVGFVGRELLVQDNLFPGGWRTDYEILWNKWSLLKDADFVVIDLGDTTRLHAAKEEITDPVFQARWQEAIARADHFVGRLAADLDLNRDLLMVVSLTPSAEALKAGDWVTPVIIVGRGFAPGSLLTSPSTRRPGVIMNTDLAPTVLDFFGVRIPEGMSGRPAKSVATKEPLSSLERLHQQAIFMHNFRVPVIKVYLSYAILVLTAAVIFILLREKSLPQKLRLGPLLLSVMAVPLAALLMPAFRLFSPLAYTVIFFLVVAGLSLLTEYCEKRRAFVGFLVLSALTAGLILGDTYTGGHLLKGSLFSYDLMGGARFYGIGNEYMGVLISAVIFASACALTVWQHRALFPGLVLVAFIATVTLGAPSLGANFGGLLTALVAFPVSFLAFAGIRFTWRLTFGLTGLGLILLAALMLFDLLQGQGTQSHVARNLLLVRQDPGAALEIVKRKMAMNIKLFRYTIWSRVLAAGIGGLLVLFYRPVGVMRVFRARHPHLFSGFVGVVVTAVAAFIFNDSGTVAAATATVFGIPPLLYILLREG